MKLYPFSALLARMKYITRWSLMHSTRPESLSEHTCDTALLAHTLCLLKASDRLSALIKCMEEQRSGNHEFDAALRQQREALEGMHCPEADWFMAHCLPCFTQNLDELTRSE